MSNLKIRTTRIHLTPDSILHDRAFSVEIADEGGGEFVIIQSESGELAIEHGEWKTLRDAIDMMFSSTLLQKVTPEPYEIGTYLPEQGGFLIGYLNGGGIIMSSTQFNATWSETFNIVDEINYTAEKFSDWRVPNIDELNLAWVNREKLSGLDMDSGDYWSSTEHPEGGAWFQNFSNGKQSFDRYPARYKFRPVRTMGEEE